MKTEKARYFCLICIKKYGFLFIFCNLFYSLVKSIDKGVFISCAM